MQVKTVGAPNQAEFAARSFFFVQLEDEVDEEALLDRHLQGAHGSLAAAYDALNNQYANTHTATINPNATPKHGYAGVAQYVAETRPLETLGAFDFDAQSASSEPLSDMGSGTIRERKARRRGEVGTPRSDASGTRLLAYGDEPDERLRPARLLTAVRARLQHAHGISPHSVLFAASLCTNLLRFSASACECARHSQPSCTWGRVRVCTLCSEMLALKQCLASQCSLQRQSQEV